MNNDNNLQDLNNQFEPKKSIFKRFDDWLDSLNWFLQITVILSIVFCIRTFVFGLYWVPTGSMEPTILVGEVFLADKLTTPFRKIKHGDIISFNDPTFKYSDNYLYSLIQKYVYGADNWTKRVIGIPGDHIEGKIENGVTVIYRNNIKIDETVYVNKYPLVSILETSHQLCMPNFSKLSFDSIPFLKINSDSRVRTYDPALAFDDKNQPFYKIDLLSLRPNAQNPRIYYSNSPHYYESQDNFCETETCDIFDITLKDKEYWGMGDNRRGSFDSRGFGKIKQEWIHGRIIFRLFSFDTPNSLVWELLTNPINFFKNKLRTWKRWFSIVK